MRDVRARQVDEADTNVMALLKSQEMAQARADYYASREFMNADETPAQALTSRTVGLITQGGAFRYLAGKLAGLGTLKLGSPTTAGADVGFDFAARSIEADAGALDATANVLSVRAQLATRLGEYHRRQDEWTFQADLAAREVKQIVQQVTAAQIRLAITQRELANHDLQIDNARATDEFLRDKYTSQDLYQWMIRQVSGVYFRELPACLRPGETGGAVPAARAWTGVRGDIIRPLRVLGFASEGTPRGRVPRARSEAGRLCVSRWQRPRVRADETRVARLARARAAHRA